MLQKAKGSKKRMSFVTFITILLPLAAVIAASPETTTAPVIALTPEELRAAGADVVNGVRTFAEQAKKGMYLDAMRENILLLQTDASDIIERLGYEVSECDTKAVIKMAAAGTGSHEVLTVMLAKDELNVLNGRLSLSLAFLKQVAEQLEDELTLSTDVGPYLAAIAFGADTTGDIIKSADKAVKAKTKAGSHSASRVRRQLANINLFGGWTVGTDGVSWTSSSGNTRFNLKPIWDGLRLTGSRSTLVSRF